MKREVYTYPKSSFLSTEKDMNLIVQMIMKNEHLKKMLYYNTRDCMSKPNLTEDETLSLFGQQIKIVPKLQVDDTALNYIFVSFDTFTKNRNNPEFRDNYVEFDILCHYSLWQMRDFELRPYKIAAELDSMFNGKHLTGIGTLEFVGANQIAENDELGGLCLLYKAIHGEEDRQKMPNPQNEAEFIKNFNALFND